jgi:NAD/NADP transhydrogenase alpha subunit
MIPRGATSAMRTFGITKARAIVGIGLVGMVALKAAALDVFGGDHLAL